MRVRVGDGDGDGEDYCCVTCSGMTTSIPQAARTGRFRAEEVSFTSVRGRGRGAPRHPRGK